MSLIAPIRPWGGGGIVERLWWAALAQRQELWGFRFDYPVAPVPAAGPRDSLHYYVFSERLFFDAMEPDAAGIPVHRSRHFRTYNPAYVAWFGLTSLERWLRREDENGRAAFWRQVAWLKTHAVERPDGSAVWHYTFAWLEGRCPLKAPWISAMSQGLGISCLVRAHRLAPDPDLIALARRAARVFDLPVAHGGVRTEEAGRVMYEEYPGFPLPRVLDGFLFGLLGLYDLAAEGDAAARRLFTEGIAGLTQGIRFWDYRGRWSWYGSHGYLCPPQYNKLNGALLEALGRLADAPVLRDYARAWSPGRLSLRERVEVYLVFLFTKNRSRLRHLFRRMA